MKTAIFDGKTYTLDELVNSAIARSNYNSRLATEALEEGDLEEAERFQKQAVDMLKDAKYAMENGDPDLLESYRDW